MKRLFFLILTLSAFAEPYSYSIAEYPYYFSTYFEMQGKDGFEGRAVKQLGVQTTYELYDKGGNIEGKGVVQVLSLGAFFAWAKDIDVYDKEGQQIGFIDGEVLTTASAKYKFYGEKNQWIATAYLDRASSGFIVTSAQEERTIANLKRNFVSDAIDDWKIVLYEPSALDLRLLKIFSTFAIDYQEYFKEDK